MQATALATLLAISILAAPAHASSTLTRLADAAPRSIFDERQDTAPRSVFDTINDSAPRSAEGRDEGVGEHHPALDWTDDKAH